MSPTELTVIGEQHIRELLHLCNHSREDARDRLNHYGFAVSLLSQPRHEHLQEACDICLVEGWIEEEDVEGFKSFLITRKGRIRLRKSLQHAFEHLGLDRSKESEESHRHNEEDNSSSTGSDVIPEEVTVSPIAELIPPSAKSVPDSTDESVLQVEREAPVVPDTTSELSVHEETGSLGLKVDEDVQKVTQEGYPGKVVTFKKNTKRWDLALNLIKAGPVGYTWNLEKGKRQCVNDVKTKFQDLKVDVVVHRKGLIRLEPFK